MSIDLVVFDETCSRSTSADDDDLDHYYCCDLTVALCGADVTDATLWFGDDDMPNECVVCLDLEDKVCPRCGQ